jgi:hypothetical protein
MRSWTVPASFVVRTDEHTTSTTSSSSDWLLKTPSRREGTYDNSWGDGAR